MSRLRPLLAHTKVWVQDDGRERLVGLSVVGSHFTFYEFDERGDRVATVATELPFSNPLTHDFSLTEHYYIVAENPVRYCVEIKFYGAFVYLHAIDATPVRCRSTEPVRPRHRREMT